MKAMDYQKIQMEGRRHLTNQEFWNTDRFVRLYCAGHIAEWSFFIYWGSQVYTCQTIMEGRKEEGWVSHEMLSHMAQLLFKKPRKNYLTWSNEIIGIWRKKINTQYLAFFFFKLTNNFMPLKVKQKRDGRKKQNTVSAFLRPKCQTCNHQQPSLDLCDPLGLKDSRTQFLCSYHKFPDPLVFFPGYYAHFFTA